MEPTSIQYPQKYLGLTLVKQMKQLYNKIFKTLKKEIEEDTEEKVHEKNLPCSWINRINTAKSAILTKAIYRLKAIPIKFSAQFFAEIGEAIFSFMWKQKRNSTAKTILKNKRNSGGISSLISNCTIKYSKQKQTNKTSKHGIYIKADTSNGIELKTQK